MYHVYKNGYSTLPNLKKIPKEEVFEVDKKESEEIQKEKKQAIKSQNYFLEHNNQQKFYEICEEFILNNYNGTLKSKKYLDIAKEIDEDLMIHRIDGEKDYTSSIHVCFPSHWYPENKIGRSFKETHSVVPMNLNNSKKLVEAIINGGIFERFVWSIIYEKKYNFHPDKKHKEFDILNPQVLIKVERQVTVGFPEHNFCLFILRQYLIEEKHIDKKLLSDSIRGMTPEQRSYKSLENYETIINYLEN
jgi:hypothetical protein